MYAYFALLGLCSLTVQVAGHMVCFGPLKAWNFTHSCPHRCSTTLRRSTLPTTQIASQHLIPISNTLTTAVARTAVGSTHAVSP
jgi:hypothetical protein